MSNSRPHKRVFAGLLACVTLLAASGCGDKQNGVDNQPTGQTGGVTAATPSTAEAAEPVHPGATREADLVPVDVALEDGGFGSTPKVIHVPSEFLVLITATADAKGPYSLSVLSPSSAQTFKIASNATQKITQDGLAAGKQIKLMLGGKTVRIVADAEPGP